MRRCLLFFLLILAVWTSSCGQRPVTETTAAATKPNSAPAPDTSPRCQVVSNDKVGFGPNANVTAWNLEIAHVQELTARLALLADGQSKTLTEITVKWDKWPADAKPAKGRLVYLVQDGAAFGAKDKRLASLSLSIPDGPSSSRTERRSSDLLEGDWASFGGTQTTSGDVSAGTPHVLSVELFRPATSIPDVTSWSSTLDSLLEASKKGVRILVVVVEVKNLR